MSMRTYDATAYAPGSGDYQASSTQDDSVSVFDRYSSFDGTFNLTRDLRVEGQVKGTISCKGTLFVAQGATVDADIDAENITVAGDLNGEIQCHGRLQILASGKVKGRIATVTLVINEGAVYEGELVMESAQASGAPRSLRSRATPAASGGNAGTATTEPAASQTVAGGSTFIRRFGGQEAAWDSTPDDAGDDDDNS